MSLTPESTAEMRDELGVERIGHQPRERRLADARRPPQDHRVQLARGERDGERLARREQVPLADDVVDRARAQALGERDARVRDLRTAGEEIVHGWALPAAHYAR